MKPDNIQYGRYQHYKTDKIYEVIGSGRHSETYEEMIIYRALYHCDKFGDNQVWVRPREMFLEKVTYNGNVIPRFRYIED
jgi:hypothetical protein